MKHTIGGRTFEIEGEPIAGDHGEVRGIALRFRGPDGDHEGVVMDQTYTAGFRPSNRHPDITTVEEWVREKIRHEWLDLGSVSVRTCPTCIVLVCTKSKGSPVKCRNDHVT